MWQWQMLVLVEVVDMEVMEDVMLEVEVGMAEMVEVTMVVVEDMEKVLLVVMMLVVVVGIIPKEEIILAAVEGMVMVEILEKMVDMELVVELEVVMVVTEYA